MNESTSRNAAMWSLCLSCATHVHGARPSTPAYALRVARLLYGTGAHESGGFVHRRQMGFSYRNEGGAWGFWQCEAPTIRTCLHRLDFNETLRQNAADWLFDSEPGHAPSDWYLAFAGNGPTAWHALLNMTAISERLSVLLARLAYMGDPDPVPESVEDQAEYWGSAYNTRRDPVMNQQWVDAYARHLSVEMIRDIEEGANTDGA